MLRIFYTLPNVSKWIIPGENPQELRQNANIASISVMSLSTSKCLKTLAVTSSNVLVFMVSDQSTRSRKGGIADIVTDWTCRPYSILHYCNPKNTKILKWCFDFMDTRINGNMLFVEASKMDPISKVKRKMNTVYRDEIKCRIRCWNENWKNGWKPMFYLLFNQI
jgi:hypothetical protein